MYHILTIRRLCMATHMVAIVLFLASCISESPNMEFKIDTNIENAISSPVEISGVVSSTSDDFVLEKGIIFGLTDNLVLENSKLANWYFTAPLNPPSNFQPIMDLSTGGWILPSPVNGYVKTHPGTGKFTIKLIGLTGSTDYFVRTYAQVKNQTYYGDVKKFRTSNFKRNIDLKLDFANVFWTKDYSLFDLLTDEVILPDQNGNYNFWYSSNENINVFQITKSTDQLEGEGFLFYKFKTRENCQRWCDIRSGKVVPSN